MIQFNAIAYLIAVLLAVVAALAWFEPSVADYFVRTLHARAAGIRAKRRAYRKAYDAALLQEFPQAAEYGSGN